MGKYIYDDFYEGVLHLIIIVLPIFVGLLDVSQGSVAETVATPVSLLISLAGGIYEARNIYKNKKFLYIRRIKIEMLIELVILAVSLFFTVYIFLDVNLRSEEQITFFASDSEGIFGGYLLPFCIYVGSVGPYIVEVIFVAVKDLTNSKWINSNKRDFNESEKSEKNIAFNIKSASVN